LGISADSVFAHKVWAESLGLKYPLLSDYNSEVVKKYGIFRNEDIGRAKIANERAIFVVDKNGALQYVNVSPITEPPNIDEILKVLDNLK
jgi:peroxiredoxin